jgi:diphthamide biosynthesis protein 2
MERVKAILKAANKKFYTFVVGKVNVPKLANFQEIDIFVLIGCPLSSLLDSRDFFKPMITPLELELALVP